MLEPMMSAMLRLKALGWGARRIAAESLAARARRCGRWLKEGSWQTAGHRHYGPKALDGLEVWVEDALSGAMPAMPTWSARSLQPRRALLSSLRTVERAVAHLRQELRAEARATVRFETRPGQQLQIDFGQRRVEIDGAPRLVSFFVATLGYSRRIHVRAFAGERQEHWFAGMESAFAAFGGVRRPEEVLLDNARALILSHDVASREVVVNPKLHAFARHWGFQVRACAPYRPRTKGKDERGVGYVKGNAVAGPELRELRGSRGASGQWTRDVADRAGSRHDGRGSDGAVRRDEAGQVEAAAGMWTIHGHAELSRRVGPDCAVEMDTNAYSVPWRLIGERVRVLVTAEAVRITHAGVEVACHRRSAGRRGRIIERAHFEGVVGAAGRAVRIVRSPE